MSAFPTLKGFVFTNKLGSGSYATVYKAYKKDATGTRDVVAIKCVEKSTLSKNAVENLLTEISILKKVKHEFIVELKDFQWDARYIYLILEYCAGGDLSHFIRKRRSLPENIVQRFLQQIATALQVLRSHNICHLDLKPQNILLSSTVSPVVKLGDFGFAQYTHDHEKITSLRGSPLYMAPEILLEQRYDAKVDLWSLGIILYECLFGQAPFSSETFTELAEKIKNTAPIKIPPGVDISDDCRHLLLSLLKRNPALRISFEDFFAHPFVDLEHMPSPQSYQKGVSLIQKAVTADSTGHRSEALKLYCQGLQYLMPCFNDETNFKKKEVLKERVVAYIRRAEDLKRLVGAPSQRLNGGEPRPAQEEMPADLRLACAKMQEARSLSLTGNYHHAMRLYKEALEGAVPFIKNLRPSRQKEVYGKMVSKWMTEAEDVKSFLTVQQLQFKRSLSPSSALTSCKIQ